MKTIQEKLQCHIERQRRNQAWAIARQREKQADPAWRAEQYEKQRKRQQRSAERSKLKPIKRSLKGRTPRAAERTMMDKIGSLPCIACYVHGVTNDNATIHHINGRTADGAHAYVLSLCDHHHQHAAPAAIRAIYPWLVPVHADGTCGGKAAFEALNGTQENLYSLCLEMIT
ncbi:Ref family recombination enhancement nuclease [Citrobacter freundii]|uniref:Ref family recombination enhancement nuclease n=1 Tax=Citrobacter freundii TaxID=546 RepID=UPI0024E0E5B8|nr:Ref family recombination enhancement nuclease [Citrobacter freundii]WOR42026.1 Ref family recombination enhancement nuclease [Citrobacter freundii]